jgi:putative PIN family toxin of toxin-antitoxin system
MMRVVLDTDVIVAAVRSASGASRAILSAVTRDQVEMLCSVALFLEYEEVLSRRALAAEIGWSSEERELALATLADLVTPVETFFAWRPQLRDPDDETVSEVAINGRADAIAAFNLVDFGSAPRRFGIALLRPSDLLRRL